MEYQGNKLRKYIDNSELRVYSDNLKVRLSSELAVKWDNGVYANAMKHFQEYIDEINSLNIKYPSSAKPVFYIYLVPDDNFVELLGYPFTERKGGGKPVACFDLDGFMTAYGQSQNFAENVSAELPDISRIVNGIHEFAHNVHHQFFQNRNRYLAEGFAECLPLYTLNYENKFTEHRELVLSLEDKQIFSLKELLEMEKEGTFGRKTRIPQKSVSFDWAYISSYLWIRGYLVLLQQKFGLNKIEATQKFLEIIKSSGCFNEFLVCELADLLEYSREDFLINKTLQFIAIEDIKNKN